MKVLVKYLLQLVFLICMLVITVQKTQLKAVGEPCECAYEKCICSTRSYCTVLEHQKNVSYCNRKKGIVCCPQDPGIIYYFTPVLPSELACARFANMTSKICPQNYITGGELAKSKEFPPVALIGKFNSMTNETNWFCGGTLISERFVLTAAHCMKGGDINVVRLGDLDFNSAKDDVGVQQFSVSRMIPHINYNQEEYFDIMLLELNGTVTFTDYVHPACILTPNLTVYNEGKFWAVGWGYTEGNPNMSPQLRRVLLNEFKNCNPVVNITYNFERGLRERTQFCLQANITDTCKGDSGGPLLIKFPHYLEQYRCLYMVAGVVSKGQDECGEQNIPSINTNVTAFLSFIEFHVWPKTN